MSNLQRNVIGVVHPWEYDWKDQVNHMAALIGQGNSMQVMDAGKVIGLAWALEDADEKIESLNGRLDIFDRLNGVGNTLLDLAEAECKTFREVAEELCRAATVEADAETGDVRFVCPTAFEKAVRMAYTAVLKSAGSREDAANILAAMQHEER